MNLTVICRTFLYDTLDLTSIYHIETIYIEVLCGFKYKRTVRSLLSQCQFRWCSWKRKDYIQYLAISQFAGLGHLTFTTKTLSLSPGIRFLFVENFQESSIFAFHNDQRLSCFMVGDSLCGELPQCQHRFIVCLLRLIDGSLALDRSSSCV